MAGRDIIKVIEAMQAACTVSPEATDLAPKLEVIKNSAYYTPAEAMCIHWSELVVTFNSFIFNTDDQAQWKRKNAPAWADPIGRILTGEAPHVA